MLSIHLEAVEDPRPVLDQIREAGALAGIVSNPPTPVECLETYLDHCDLVLTMSVMPGFGGQAFEPVALDKLRWLRKMRPPKCCFPWTVVSIWRLSVLVPGLEPIYL